MMPFPLLGRRRFLQLGAALCTGGAATAAYAWHIEPHWVELVCRDLPVANLPSGLVGQTLVQLSDIHVGPQVDDTFLLGAFDLVNELEPAFVAITGDFMTARRCEEIGHVLRVLERLKPGRIGTVAVLGNHDYGSFSCNARVADRLAAGLGGLGIDVLRNEQRTLGGLTFVGLDDLWGPFFAPRRAFAGLPADSASVVLCHNPDAVDQPGWGEWRGWVLAGHTHGGQCKPPCLRPPCLPVDNPRYIAGEVDAGAGRRLYINRALGYLLRVRFNVRPEITVFRLTRPSPAEVPPAMLTASSV